MLYELNGVESNTPKVVSDIPTGLAFSNFNVLVQNDAFSLRKLLLSDRQVLFGPVRQLYIENGQDFNALLNVLGISHG